MRNYIDNCECYIHSLKQGEAHTLGVADIIRKTGDNMYEADYNGVRCTAIYNPIVGRYFVDDIYGVIREQAARTHNSR